MSIATKKLRRMLRIVSPPAGADASRAQADFTAAISSISCEVGAREALAAKICGPGGSRGQPTGAAVTDWLRGQWRMPSPSMPPQLCDIAEGSDRLGLAMGLFLPVVRKRQHSQAAQANEQKAKHKRDGEQAAFVVDHVACHIGRAMPADTAVAAIIVESASARLVTSSQLRRCGAHCQGGGWAEV